MADALKRRMMHMKAGSWTALCLVTALCLIFLELNKNTLLGWALALMAAAVFVSVYAKLPRGFAAKAGMWLLYLSALAGIVFITRPPVKRVPAFEKTSGMSAVIQTDKGPVQGVVNEKGTVELFAGIPYAKPPVDELRWRKPQEADPWSDVLVCDRFAPMSMQSVNPPFMGSLAQIAGYHDYRISLKDNYRPPVSEDSLYINLWKPAGKQEKLPVIVYIHGGSLQMGQPWYSDYSGEGFAESGAVCVNMGYRLGVFGFLAEEEMLKEEGTAGNFGLLDQIAALQWVQRNIEAFGGDPGNVTLIGESAGAVCVDALCVSPLAEGLFRRAVLESSTLSSPVPPHSYRSFEEALSSGRQLMEKYHCASLDELRKLDASLIADEMQTQHHVTPDGYVLAKDPYVLRREGVHNEEALLHGFNTEESGPFIIFSHAKMKNYEEKIRSFFGEYTDEVMELYPAQTDEEADRMWAEIYGAVFFNYSHYCLNRLAVRNGEPVFQYLFAKHNGRLSCWHSGELVYAFHMIPEDSSLYEADDRALSDMMHAYWLNFAKNGTPGGEGLPRFENNADSARIMRFENGAAMEAEPYLKLYAILDGMYGFQ